MWFLPDPCHRILYLQKTNLGTILTPVLRLPLLTQPARHGLKYVIPSDPQTGSYSCILQPQFTLQLPVRFLWGMVREGLKEKRRRSSATFTKIKPTGGPFLLVSHLSISKKIVPWDQSYGTTKSSSSVMTFMTLKQNSLAFWDYNQYTLSSCPSHHNFAHSFGTMVSVSDPW